MHPRITSLVAVVGLVTVLTFSSSCKSSGPASATAAKETAFERITQTSVIRAAYIPYPPAVIKDPNSGELSGIFVDALRKVGENLGLKVEFVAEEGFGSFAEGIKDGRYDIVASNIWPSAARSKHMYFSSPLYYSGLCVWVRAEDRRFDSNLGLLNQPDVRLATMDGEIAELIANAQFPKMARVAAPQLSEFSVLLENVRSSKADVAFMEPYPVQAFLKNHPGALQNLTPSRPLRVYANTFPMPMDDKLKAMIDVSLSELANSGYLDTLLTQYTGGTNSFFSVAYPYRASEVNDSSAKR